MKFVFRDLFSSAELIAVYCNTSSTDRFYVGKTIIAGEQDVLLQLLRNDGKKDDLCFAMYGAFYRVEVDSPYLNMIGSGTAQLCEQFNVDNPWIGFLSYVRNNNKTIRVKFIDNVNELYGVIESYDMDEFTIRSVSYENTLGTILHIRREQVSMLLCEQLPEINVLNRR